MSFHLRSSALAIGVGDRPFVTATPPRFGGPDAPRPADKVPTPVIPGTFVSVYLAAGVTDPSTGPTSLLCRFYDPPSPARSASTATTCGPRRSTPSAAPSAWSSTTRSCSTPPCGTLSIVFAGPPGSGKTTLLTCCAAELDPSLRVVVAEEVSRPTCRSPTSTKVEARPVAWNDGRVVNEAWHRQVLALRSQLTGPAGTAKEPRPELSYRSKMGPPRGEGSGWSNGASRGRRPRWRGGRTRG